MDCIYNVCSKDILWTQTHTFFISVICPFLTHGCYWANLGFIILLTLEIEAATD